MEARESNLGTEGGQQTLTLQLTKKAGNESGQQTLTLQLTQYTRAPRAQEEDRGASNYKSR
eukprot:15466575-Alexandrium_andersonii.AAC.1